MFCARRPGDGNVDDDDESRRRNSSELFGRDDDEYCNVWKTDERDRNSIMRDIAQAKASKQAGRQAAKRSRRRATTPSRPFQLAAVDNAVVVDATGGGEEGFTTSLARSSSAEQLAKEKLHKTLDGWRGPSGPTGLRTTVAARDSLTSAEFAAATGRRWRASQLVHTHKAAPAGVDPAHTHTKQPSLCLPFNDQSSLSAAVSCGPQREQPSDGVSLSSPCMVCRRRWWWWWWCARSGCVGVGVGPTVGIAAGLLLHIHDGVSSRCAASGMDCVQFPLSWTPQSAAAAHQRQKPALRRLWHYTSQPSQAGPPKHQIGDGGCGLLCGCGVCGACFAHAAC
jgi:hypothetical protein